MSEGRGADDLARAVGLYDEREWDSLSDEQKGAYRSAARCVLAALSAEGPVVIEDGEVRRLVEADHFGSLRFNGSVKYVYDCVDAEGMIRDGSSLVPLFYVAPVSSREGDGA